MNFNILDDEAAILNSVSEGDELAFKQLHRFYLAELQPLVSRHANDGIDTQEILQETFLKVWLNRDQLPEIENFRAWIFKIASREFLIALRRKLNYEKQLDTFSALDDPNHPSTPFDITHLEAVKKTISNAVQQLSPQRRTIYEMSRQQGMKIDEIAQQLSLSPQTVKNVLQIVVKLIREHLIAAGYHPLILFIIFFNF